MKTSPTAFAFLAGLTIAAAGFLPVAFSAQPPTPVTPKFDESKALPYRITRGDILAISIFGETNLTIGGKKVENRGTINLNLIGDIRVTGMTLAEAKTAIENAYRDGRFLRAPEATVSIEQYAQRSVSIQGLVNQPARYELPPDQQLTLKELIIKAGGFKDTAKGSAVRVIRTLPDGTLKVFENLDVDSVIRGKSKARAEDANFLLEPDDSVYVPEKMI